MEYIAKLLENTKINEHIIKLKKDKQSTFGFIYSLKQVELEILKIYIITILVNGFFWSFKSLAGATILIDRKLDRSLCFCVDYKSLNNIIIKN